MVARLQVLHLPDDRHALVLDDVTSQQAEQLRHTLEHAANATGAVGTLVFSFPVDVLYSPAYPNEDR